jgi:cyclophilin family peptidyl-prolyl cis-trans isomerase
MIIPWLSPHHLKDDIQNYQTEILALQQKQQELVKDLDTMTLSIKEYNTKIHVMNKENNAMFQDLRENGGVHTQLSLETEQYAEVEKAEEGLFRRLDDLEKYIQKTSAKLAAQKFGSEPYRVKVNVEDLRGDMSSFVIDLAPTTEMPYAVYHFLQMVDQNLWDGLALMLNGGTSESSINQHWMATTMKMDIRYGHHAWAWEGQRFENANLTHMAFTEHSTTYPPPGKFQYSVAFSGHPGGPSFCIRLDEDSQEEHITDIHQQSSTFGIVVEGMDVLQRYNQQSNIDPNDEAKDKHAATSSQHFEMLTIKSIELLSTL